MAVLCDKLGIFKAFQTLLSAVVIAREVLLQCLLISTWDLRRALLGLAGLAPSRAALLWLAAAAPGWAAGTASTPRVQQLPHLCPRFCWHPEKRAERQVWMEQTAWGVAQLLLSWFTRQSINSFLPLPAFNTGCFCLHPGIFRVGEIRRKQPSVFHDPQQKLHDELVTEEHSALTSVALFLI